MLELAHKPSRAVAGGRAASRDQKSMTNRTKFFINIPMT